MKRYLCIISLFLFSCEEEITLELNQESEKIVVEGVIEQGFPPYVILSKNQGFFDPIDITTYANLFINDAEIKVWKAKEILSAIELQGNSPISVSSIENAKPEPSPTEGIGSGYGKVILLGYVNLHFEKLDKVIVLSWER